MTIHHIRILLLVVHLFNGLFSRTTWVSRHQKGKPFWILLEQEMIGWQWHQLDHMQVICTSLQTDNHAITSPIDFLQAGCPSCLPTNSIKALKAKSTEGKRITTAYIQPRSWPLFKFISVAGGLKKAFGDANQRNIHPDVFFSH